MSGGKKDNFQAAVVFLLFITILCLLCFDIVKRANIIVPIYIEEDVLTDAGLSKNNLKSSAKTESTNNNMPTAGDLTPTENTEEIVVFNRSSLKYHKESCVWAKKCKRCVQIHKYEAQKYGGVPCRICGE